MIQDSKKNMTPSEKIEQYRKDNGITYTFIANKIDLSVSHIHKCLLSRSVLTENTRKKINQLWDTDF